jgi:cyclophilin family peptidyl-prolyl cis-trans isomerase
MSVRNVWSCGWAVAVAAVVAVSGAGLQADDAAMTPEAANAAWAKAEAEIDRIEARLTALQTEFQAAPADQQAKLRTEAMGLVETIKQQFRAIGQVTPLVYASKAGAAPPANQKAVALAQQTLGLAYSENRYPDALKIANAILKVDPKSQVALNVAGVSHFATHDFTKAVEVLSQGQAANLLIPELGGHYLDSAKNYVGYWQKEQELRTKEAALQGDAQLPRVLLKTTRGDVLLELFEDNAPNTVANFISLVEKGYYNGSPFHRVLPNFMAQGGTPGKNVGGIDGPGYTIECECYRPDFRRHFAGTLSMAHAGKDTGGSQFFITHLPTPHLDGEGGSTSHHTVFGRVVEGMNVVAAIQQEEVITSATVVRKRNHAYTPATKPDR